jgi:hypothetical protein
MIEPLYSINNEKVYLVYLATFSAIKLLRFYHLAKIKKTEYRSIVCEILRILLLFYYPPLEKKMEFPTQYITSLKTPYERIGILNLRNNKKNIIIVRLLLYEKVNIF